jgi:Flp pilus assembly protein TadD
MGARSTGTREEAAAPAAARRPRRVRAFAWRAAAAGGLLVWSAGCASLPRSLYNLQITPAELLAGAPLGVVAVPPISVADPADVLALTPEMKAFADAHVDRKSADNLKLSQLVTAIMGKKTFGVTYDESTRTAADTFLTRRGNCLSFSNMFVAMARYVGLNAEFQEVEIPPDWTLDKETFVLNRHVDVYVDMGQLGSSVVDFNIEDFKTTYPMRVISDARALAHFYNNLGVERMQAGDTAAALWCFRTAIASDDGRFSPAWTNLGTLYLRRGHAAHAEAAYRQALEVNSAELVAISDLAGLYGRVGDLALAARYRKLVEHHRWRNPYYRYELARHAYADKHYDEAIGHLKYAARQRPKEDRFPHLLALCYLGKGDTAAARRWLARAEEVAATGALKREYAAEIAALPADDGRR